MHLDLLSLEESKALLLDGIDTIKFGIRNYIEKNGRDMVVIDQRFFDEGLQMIEKEKEELLQKIKQGKQ